MLKRCVLLLAMLCAGAAFAADVNKASAAELDAIKGIGPGLSTKILDARKQGDFKDWNDLIGRVNGMGTSNAAKFSSQGLTVGGLAYQADKK